MILPVQVKPYVKHLLVQQYGKKSPIEVRLNTDLGYLFYASFGRRTVADELLDPLEGEGVMELERDDALEVIEFYLGGKFDKEMITADSIKKLGLMLEGYCRIFMKGFSVGYRCLLNSEAGSATVFHQLYGFDEEVLTVDNAIKIVQRESKEMRIPFSENRRRKLSIVYTK